VEETVRVVRDWQEAANRQDVAGVLARSAPDIVIVGPRGEARGHEALHSWLTRAGLSLTTRQLYARGDSAVADQHGVWRTAETGEVIGSQHRDDCQVGGLVYLYVPDVDAWQAAALAAGLALSGPPKAQPWGVRDFRLTDPDGNQLNSGTRLPDAGGSGHDADV
jgi:catechol 2,3-dioxygenase-like lactoylglutathione lyase family enzyme